MKKKVKSFVDSGINSLIVSVEFFNRPSDIARKEAVLLLLNHAFEMLLKAIVLEKTGKLRLKTEKYNYGFEKCLNICFSQLDLIDEDAHITLKNINSFRDAAAHDLLEMSEGLLYYYSLSAITIFRELLKTIFGIKLETYLPNRILPITAKPPKDLNFLIEDDLEEAKKLLVPRKRRQEEALAKIRPYTIIENNLREIKDKKSMVKDKTIARKLKKGIDWKKALPFISNLNIEAFEGVPLTIHVSKKKGVPVRLDQAAPTALAFRYINPEDKYPFLTTELQDKLNINQYEMKQLGKLFSLKGNPKYHQPIRVSKAGFVQRYSNDAYTLLDAAIKEGGIAHLMSEAKKGNKIKPESIKC